MDRVPLRRAKDPDNRWLQLALGVACMATVANVHYGWSLFFGPLDAKFQWGREAIQLAFTIFVLAETWLMPVTGHLADRFGTRPVVMGGGILIGFSWGLNSSADTLSALYIGAAAGGAGAGAVYSACIGHALKWFADRRGLAVGLAAAGFGTVSAATVLPVYAVMQSHGYEIAFLYFGLGQGLVVALLGLGLEMPAGGLLKAQNSRPPPDTRNYRPLEVLATRLFWVMYLMFFLAAAAGLMAVAQLAQIAKHYNVANVPVTIVDLTLPALAFALAIDRVFSGLARPFFGAVSDLIGREKTMFVAFGVEALAIIAVAHAGHDPLMFVLLTGVIFFSWGEIYSLFPAVCADTFGANYAATHAGMLHTAKGAAALLVLVVSGWSPPAADWHVMIYCAAGLNCAVAVLALVSLSPLRARQRAADRAIYAASVRG